MLTLSLDAASAALRRPFGALALAALAAGCATANPTAGRRATATLADAQGRQVAVVRVTEVAGGGGVLLAGDFQGLPAGAHGIHFHMVGSCSAADAFASAGGHFNPTARKHGLDTPEGPHAGDLPNLDIAAAGTGSLRTVSPRVTLSAGAGSLLDADGTALVVHAAPDDQKTDPSGNSGARIACGVIRAD